MGNEFFFRVNVTMSASGHTHCSCPLKASESDALKLFNSVLVTRGHLRTRYHRICGISGNSGKK